MHGGRGGAAQGMWDEGVGYSSRTGGKGESCIIRQTAARS